MVEMHLAALQVERATSTPILLLQENGGGKRTLPIYIGQVEAQAIAQALRGVVPPRPMTHDLIRDLLEALGASLECVVVTELRDRTFYAEIRLLVGGKRHRVSARPSDALALAVRTGATIFAEDSLVDAEGIVIAGEDPSEDDAGTADDLVSQFKEFIEGINPADFDG